MGICCIRLDTLKQIKHHGGTVQENFEVEADGTSNHVIFISEPNCFRREKYLLAIIAGVPLVHFSWVRRSVDSSGLLPLGAFELPTGLSPVRPFMIFPHHWVNYETQSEQFLFHQTNSFYKEVVLNTRAKLTVFEGLKLLNLCSSLFQNILVAAGALVVSKDDKPFMNALLAGESVYAGRRMAMDFIVVDAMAYSEACAAYSTNGSQAVKVKRSKPSQRTGNAASARQPTENDSILSYEEFQLIQHVLHPVEDFDASFNLNINSIVKNNLRVVTVDWVTSCIQLGTYIEPNVSDMFSLPAEPIQKPAVFKNQAASGGERFNKLDVVYYQCGGTTFGNCSRAIGKILGFTRRAAGCPMQVRVEKLIPGSGGNNNSGVPPTATENMLRITKDLTPSSTVSAMAKFQPQYNALRKHPSEQEYLIDASMIMGKAALMHRSDFDRLRYALETDDVFSMSVVWDRWYQHCLNAQKQQDENSCKEGQDSQEDGDALASSQDF
jgi:hypothetical protein